MRCGAAHFFVTSFVHCDPSASMSEPATKKVRGPKQWDWRITISTPQTFKTFLTIVYRVLVQCPFALVKSSTFSGLRVDSMDSSMSCMIKASYECEIESNVDLTGESFCVLTATFNTLLKDVQPGHILTLTRYAGSGDLTMTSYNKDDGTNRSTCTLTLLEEEGNGQELRMQDITYSYMVEIDLAKLKSYCKTAADINSTHVEFKLEEPDESNGGVEEVKGGDAVLKHLFFSVGASSDAASFTKTHHSVTSRVDSSAASAAEEEVQYMMRAVPIVEGQEGYVGETVDYDAVRLVEQYNEVFSTTYLNSVLKSMDRQTVQLYMSKSLPLVIRYSLGNDFSHVQVILAPKIRDS